MVYRQNPTSWILNDCEYCYKRSFISLDDEWDLDHWFCPNCGQPTETIVEDYRDAVDNYEEYEE